MTIVSLEPGFLKLAYPGERRPLDDFEKAVALHLQDLDEPYDYESWAYHFELRNGQTGLLRPVMFVPDFVLHDGLALECFAGHDKATLKQKKRKCAGLWQGGHRAAVLNTAVWERFGCGHPTGLASLIRLVRDSNSWEELSAELYFTHHLFPLAASA